MVPVTTETCAICGKICKGRVGLNVHLSKSHTTQERQGHAADSVPTIPAPSVAIDQLQQNTTNKVKIKELHVLIQTVKANTTILKRIPKAARIQSAIEYAKLVSACTKKDAPFLAWAHLLTFSFVAFKSPDRKNKSTSSLSIATIVKRNSELWVQLKIKSFKEFSDSLLSNLTRRKKSKNAKEAEHLRIKLVQSKLSDGDISGAIRILSSNDTIVPQNMETYQKLLEKHPESNVSIEVPKGSVADVQPVSATEVTKSIYAFAAGSSGGMDGIKPQHLKDLIGKETGDHGQKVIESLCGFSNLCLSGNVPNFVTPFLYGASLCGLTKKDNGVRPIAIGNTIRRLVSIIASARMSERLGNEFRPKQLGFGTRGGSEAGAHAARHFIKSNQESLKVMLKLDFRNAYNELERHQILVSTKQHCPEIFPFIFQCYSQPSWLSFGDFEILSQRGCQQGDPCGSAIFCLAIHPMILSLSSEFNVWYMDDGTLGGSAETVLDDLSTIIDKSTELGLELNFSKCEIKILGNPSKVLSAEILNKFNNIAPGIVNIPGDIELLGAPLTETGIASALSHKVDKLKVMVARMEKLTAHHAYCLLRSSISIPQLNYLLRSTPCWKPVHVLQEYDNLLKSTMEKIVNCRFYGDSWNEATLPVKLGGLGLRNATNLCYSSFLGSIHSVSDLVIDIVPSFSITLDDTVGEALDLWKSLMQSDLLADSERKFQHKWDFELCSRLQQRVMDSCTTEVSKARLLANNTKESGAWLNAFPFSSLGTLLDDQSFRIAVSLRIGIPLCVAHTCVCGKQADEFGYHALSCNKSAGRLPRHAMANDLIKRALVTCRIPAILEPTGCNRSDGKQPDGLSLVPWKNGKPLLWDFTCADTLAKTYVKGNSRKPGFAAEKRENYKRTLYTELVTNFHFTPVCIETLGTWGEGAKQLIKRIGELMQNITGEKRSTSFLMQRISVAVQKGNAASILGTVPFDSNLDDIHYL